MTAFDGNDMAGLQLTGKAMIYGDKVCFSNELDVKRIEVYS